MKKYEFASLALMILFSISASSQDKKSESFSIVAFGDMPYVLPGDYLRFENLIKTVNEQDQVFNIHAGDIKSSSSPC